MPSNSGKISAFGYAVISIISLLIGISLFLLFVFKADTLVAAGISNKVFFVLLIPLALSSAGFLFGGLKSFAKYKGKVLGGVLELGGPVVVFCLVLLGGFKLVPSEEQPLDIRIYFEDLAGNSLKIKEGEVLLHLENDNKTENVLEKEYVDFKNIPYKYRMQSVDIEINSENLVFDNNLNKLKIKLIKNQYALKIKLADRCLNFSGTILKDSFPLVDAEVKVEDVITHTDASGAFELTFPPTYTNTKYILKLKHKLIGEIDEPIFPCINNDLNLNL